MVSWHSGPKIGCDAPGGIFANVSTDAMQVSEVAAKWALDDAGGKPGVVIFTDCTYQIAIDKADRMKETIEAGGRHGAGICRHADRRNLDPDGPADHHASADSTARPGPTRWRSTTSTSTSWARRWPLPASTARARRRRGPPATGRRPPSSASALAQYQAVTVAEPLNLQGWQLVDELNRAIQGEACSGYITAPALVTEEGLARCDSNTFDPNNGYREAYAAIWGK